MNFKTWTTANSTGSIRYCLQNKRWQEGENRAKVVISNYCYGNQKQIAREFQELIARNASISKPIWQVVLSLNEDQRLGKERLTALILDCAKKLGFEDRQYMAVEHTDTENQHVHILINRIGFDGTTINDYNNIFRVLDFCKEAEQKFELKRQLSIERRVTEVFPPISNIRHLKMLEKVIAALMKSKNISEFNNLMASLSVKVYHSRGICFMDEKQVLIKGSQIGMPKKAIETYFTMDPLIKNLHLKSLYEKRCKPTLLEKRELNQLLKHQYRIHRKLPGH